MENRKKVTLGIILSIFLGISIGATIIISNPPLWFTERIVDTASKTQQGYPELEDGLHVMLVGTGSPMSDPNREGPSNLIIAGDKHFIVDSGSGSTRNLLLSGVSPGFVDAAFLTHFHSDHIADLGELMLQRWATEGNQDPLPVYGPIGVSTVVEGFNVAFALDATYRTAHHGEENIPINGTGGIAHEYDIGNATDASEVIYEEDGIRVTMFNVDHSPVYPAVGYKFEYKGRSVVISGDTIYNENLEEHAMDVDLLVIEALNAELVQIMEKVADEGDVGVGNGEIILHDIQDYHITPWEAATLAKNANVGYLVFTHMIPPLPDSGIADRMFLGNSTDIYDGEIEIGHDGFFISMPTESDKFQTTNLLQDSAPLPPFATIIISFVVLALISGAGWWITKDKKQMKQPTIIIVFAIIMGLLILTRIAEFIQIGFKARTVFHALVEAIMLAWSIFLLRNKQKEANTQITVEA